MKTGALAIVDSIPKVHHNRRYQRTPTADAVIREAYSKQRQGDRQALNAASRRLGWSRNAVCKRGAELGISRAKERPWSDAEEDILERFGHLAASRLQHHLAFAGYRRSIAAIQIKLNRCRIKQNLDGYSACSLADAFGVDVHKVLLWVRRGLLHGQRRGTNRTL